MNIQKKSLHTLMLISALSLMFYSKHASSAVPLSQAQKNLSQIEKQILDIKTRIKKDKNTQDQIQSALSKTMENIKKNQSKQQRIHLKLIALNERISNLEMSLIQTQKIIKTTQKNIYHHLNIHQQLAQEPFWQVVFGAKDPFEYYQRLELYHYLHASEKTQIEALRDNENTLREQQTSLLQSLKNLENLQQMLTQKERQFSQENENQLTALEDVNQDISHKKTQLLVAEKNQSALKKLIQQLLKNNQLQSSRPFSVMKQKLKFPVPETYKKFTKIQNGIIFATPENTQVYAVSPGKVVFSDWLNGYGYLVIVDHGWGFMTLYGNNRALLKHQGDLVTQGDVIASAGHSGSFHQTGLYFEIRQRAKVVAAQEWFGRRHA